MHIGIVAAIALVLNGSYILDLTKYHGISVPAVTFGSVDLVVILGFLIGYALLLWFSSRNLKGIDGPKKTLVLAITITTIVFLLFFKSSVSYLFIVLPVILVIGSAKFFVKILEFESIKNNICYYCLFVLLAIPTLLIVATYSYYKIPLSANEITASNWILKNTERDAIIFPSMNLEYGDGGSSVIPKNLAIHLYPAVFGERTLYLGDPTTLYVYGKISIDRQEKHRKVFLDKNQSITCTLQNELDSKLYFYANSERFYLDGIDCLKIVYKNETVKIYETKPEN
ncbi:hypothetical protein HYT84_04715 [Candidatus Micrarchaeota archaeon]|nr:hypothetical protein [Candidatus Micrarchaeota archaeon]